MTRVAAAKLVVVAPRSRGHDESTVDVSVRQEITGRRMSIPRRVRESGGPAPSSSRPPRRFLGGQAHVFSFTAFLAWARMSSQLGSSAPKTLPSAPIYACRRGFKAAPTPACALSWWSSSRRTGPPSCMVRLTKPRSLGGFGLGSAPTQNRGCLSSRTRRGKAKRSKCFPAARSASSDSQNPLHSREAHREMFKARMSSKCHH